MKTFDDLRFAICRLSGNDQCKLQVWIESLGELEQWSVREASPTYGSSPELAAVQKAIESLESDQIAELRNWLRLMDTETPEMLAAIDEGIRSFEEKGGMEFTREELEARVRQWAGVSS